MKKASQKVFNRKITFNNIQIFNEGTNFNCVKVHLGFKKTWNCFIFEANDYRIIFSSKKILWFIFREKANFTKKITKKFYKKKFWEINLSKKNLSKRNLSIWNKKILRKNYYTKKLLHKKKLLEKNIIEK